MQRLLRRLSRAFVRERGAEEFPDTPLPDDATVVHNVLLADPDMLCLLMEILGEGSMLCRLAGTCRTFRKQVLRTRRLWKHALPFDAATFSPDRRGAGAFCHFLAGLDPATSNELAVSDSLDGRVFILRAPAGTAQHQSSSSSTAPYAVSTPFELASDGTHLYVADNQQARVIKLRLAAGHLTVVRHSDDHDDATALDGTKLSDPFGVAIAPAAASSHADAGRRASRESAVAAMADRSTVFVTDRANDRVCVFDASDLRPCFAFGGSGASALSDPCGCTFSDGVLYVCDRDNGRLQLFDRYGRPLRAIGRPASARGPNGPGTFLGPCGVECARGFLFVIDSKGVRGKVVQVFSSRYESPRLWIRLRDAVRLVGVGATKEGLFVSDMRSGAEGVLHWAAWPGSSGGTSEPARNMQSSAPVPVL